MQTITVNDRQMAECEDCHKPILPTSEVQWGFVSPESSGMKATNVMGVPAIEALEKVVCKNCYLEAYKRVHPDVVLPELTGGDVVG